MKDLPAIRTRNPLLDLIASSPAFQEALDSGLQIVEKEGAQIVAMKPNSVMRPGLYLVRVDDNDCLMYIRSHADPFHPETRFWVTAIANDGRPPINFGIDSLTDAKGYLKVTTTFPADNGPPDWLGPSLAAIVA